MLEKKNKLEYAIEMKNSKAKVKDLFLDYEEAYKRLRNPTNEQTRDYRDTYFLYVEHMSKR